MNRQVQTTSGVSLERIKADEAAALSALSLRIYPQFYLYLWYDQGEWYQQTRYSPEQLATELSGPNAEFYWIYLPQERLAPVGYLKINLRAQPNNVTGLSENGLEVERIYLLREATGTGLGSQVMAWVTDRARELQRDYIYLYTMDSSPAISFYERNGYLKVGVKQLPFEQMKPEYRGMYLMLKRLL